MRNDFQSDSQKDPDELEREVDQQRAYVNETLSALEQKFSPGQIFDQVMSYTRSNGGDFSRNLVDSVKNNPLPTILTATGLAWLMIGQNRPPRGGTLDEDYYNASYGVDPTYETGGDGSGSLKDKANQLRTSGKQSTDKARQSMRNMQSSVHQGARRTRQGLHDARDSMRQQAYRARSGFNHMLNDQPLALGALGVALGALIGASLPRTSRENEMFGDARDRIAERAALATEENYEKAKEVGSRLAEDAKQETQQVAPEAGTQSVNQPGTSPRYN